MKLKPKFEPHAILYKNGFLFDVDSQNIFTSNKNPSIPKDYENWEIEHVDFTDYIKNRLEKLEIKDDDNTIELIGGVNLGKNEKCKQKVFDTNKFGDIQILQYGLNRKPHVYATKGAENNSISNRERYNMQTRLHPLHEHMCVGKYDFTHAKNVPFWHKSLIDQYEQETPIEIATITEGQIKAFKASMDGLPTIGLTSISHFKNKDTGTIHPEIVEYLRAVKANNLVILWDGDCRDISYKSLTELEDIAKRPNNFYKFAVTIKDLIQKFFPAKKLNIFFATIRTNELTNNPKGIDDLLIEFKNDKSEIIKDYKNIGHMPCHYFEWINITTDGGVKELRKWFKLDTVKRFFQFHQEQIKENDFVYYGTTYRVDKGEPIKKIDANVKNYKRIGTDYYKLVKQPMSIGIEERIIYEKALVPWTKQAITDDHGKDVIKHIERFEGFTNEPNHINYQPIVGNFWNLYYNVDHKIVKGEWTHIEILLRHLFEDQYTMALDYISILYKQPKQKLPVVCLVSRENKTGKSTFVYLMKLIFKQNMALISSHDLNSDFNSHWTSKLIVASEETILEKKESYEKIKSLTTAKYISRNEKNKAQSEIPCQVHFIFCSNHEDDFIRIDDTDSRLWIRKVQSIKNQIIDFDEKIQTEIPAFVEFIQNREIIYKRQDRLYFKPEDFRTKAFDNVVKNTEPGVIKELRENLIDIFIATDLTEVEMTAQHLKSFFNLKPEINYIAREIKRTLKIESERRVGSYRYLDATGEWQKTPPKRARFFTFKREQFLPDEPKVQQNNVKQLSITDY